MLGVLGPLQKQKDLAVEKRKLWNTVKTKKLTDKIKTGKLFKIPQEICLHLDSASSS